MKKLVKYLKPYWFVAVMAPIFMIGEVFVDLAQPKLMSKIVDEGVLLGNLKLIIQTGLLMLGLVAVGGTCGAMCTVCAVRASQSFGNDLRCAVFSRVMNMSLQQTDRFTTGSLVTRLTNDVTMTENFVSMALRMFVRSFMSFAGGIVMMLTLDVSFALVLACALPIEIVIMAIMLKKAYPLFQQVQTKLDKVNSVMQENVSGARVVKAYVREDYETERFQKANGELCAVNYRVSRLLALISPLMMLFMNVGVIAVILIGGYQVEARTIQVGAVMAAITYIVQVLNSLLAVGMVFQMVSRASASANRLAEVLETTPAIVSGTKAAEGRGEVEFRSVSFAYPEAQGEPILNHVSFHVRPGEFVAVLGATGCGKTSLVNLIPRFYDVTEGAVCVDGQDVRSQNTDVLRQKIGCVLQKSELFSGSVMDNIRWGKADATDEEVIQAAKTAQADEFVSNLTEGYQTVIGEKGASLSGGQKQRLSIARALVRKPEILIFDDSTSALDLGTEARLHEALRENLSGTTVIMIAQRIASVRNADRILLLENGTIAAEGRHEELLKTSPLYRDIYASQQHSTEVM